MHYPGNRKTAFVIVAYNRPQYLQRTFSSVMSVLSSPQNAVKVDIVLSQDGDLPLMKDITTQMKNQVEQTLPEFSYRHFHHKQVSFSLCGIM